MVDCGLPYKKIEPELKHIKALLITHVHSDHVNPSTLKMIQKKYPRIEIFGNYEVAYAFGIRNITAEGSTYAAGAHQITPVAMHHDVVCQGFIIKVGALDVFYATDTAKVDDINMKFDYIFLESNYDEDKIQAVIKESHNGYSPYKSSVYRHLSTQQCKTWYWLHRKSKDSELIELHKSRRFY